MRRSPSFALAALIALGAPLGCNTLTGVDELELVECVDCANDASVDSRVAETVPDSRVADTTPAETTVADSTVADTTPDDALDDALDDATDAPLDAVSETSEAGKFCKSNLACSDGNACTDDLCQVLTGACTNTLIDKDGDGQAPTTAGACGLDCYDGNKLVFSTQTAYFTTAYSTAAGTTSFDYDCSGVEDKQYTALGKCTRVLSTTCSTTVGWNATTVPACGGKAVWIVGCTYNSLTATCLPSTASVTRTQGCK